MSSTINSDAWFRERADRASCNLDLIETLAYCGSRADCLVNDEHEERNLMSNIFYAIERIAKDPESRI